MGDGHVPRKGREQGGRRSDEADNSSMRLMDGQTDRQTDSRRGAGWIDRGPERERAAKTTGQLAAEGLGHEVGGVARQIKNRARTNGEGEEDEV